MRFNDQIDSLLTALASDSSDEVERALQVYDVNDIVAVMAKRLLAAESSGGSSSVNGVAMTGDWSDPIDGNVNIPWDVTIYDTDGFWDEPNNQWVIPADLGGCYLITWYAVFDGSDASIDGADFSFAGDIFADPFSPFTKVPPGNNWLTNGSHVVVANEGDAIYTLIEPHGVDSYTLFGGESTTRIALTYLGTLAT
jgi:hypothetical protein